MQLFSKIFSYSSKFFPLVVSNNLLTIACGVLIPLVYICTMLVDKNLVSHLAHLSRLTIKPEKMDEMVADMQDLVGFVEQLNQLDTTGTKPLMHMGDRFNAFRADEVQGSISRSEALQNAPDHNDQFFKVPKVISK